jgi:hypothetical protein
METKILSSTGFIHDFKTEELYVLTRHWLSDIIFFGQEINYFQSLLTRYFKPNVEEDNLGHILKLEAQLQDLDYRKDLLMEQIILHQNKLGTLLDKLPSESDICHHDRHSTLEGEIFEFMKVLRIAKLDFFNTTKFSGKPKR